MRVFYTFGGDLLANPELRRFARSAAAVVLFPASEAHHFGWRYSQMVARSNRASPKKWEARHDKPLLELTPRSIEALADRVSTDLGVSRLVTMTPRDQSDLISQSLW
jgi:hypothetical protein